MNNQTVLILPYPHKFLGIQYFVKRKIGFLFNNWTKLQFQENNGFKTSQDIYDYEKKYGSARVPNELIFAGAQVYCLKNRLKENFSKHGLILALSATTEENRLKIIEALNNSETFGLRQDEKKKINPKIRNQRL